MTQGQAWHALAATQVAACWREGTASAEAVAAHMAGRARRLAGSLRCLAQLDADAALAQARSLDARRQPGMPDASLAAVTVVAKDNIAVRGFPVGGGRPAQGLPPAGSDATVVARLRAQGAVLLGTAVMSEGGWAEHHPDVPPPVNPWAPGYGTSGSSSGAAVAVAAGLCHAALGTDTGGSVRQPAAACGVYGLKPTRGRIPLDGVQPMAPELDHVGLLARSVDDVALLLAVATGRPVAGPDSTSPLRIGVPQWLQACAELPAAVGAALERAQGRLREGGCALRAMATPTLAQLEAAARAWLPLCAPAAWAAAGAAVPADSARAYAALLAAGRDMPPGQVAAARAAVAAWAQALAPVFEDCDVLLLPVSLVGPQPLHVLRARAAVPEALLPALTLTAPFNLSGHPALAVPAGLNEDGAPVGVQLVGRRGAEAQVLAAARVLERGWGPLPLAPPP